MAFRAPWSSLAHRSEHVSWRLEWLIGAMNVSLHQAQAVGSTFGVRTR